MDINEVPQKNVGDRIRHEEFNAHTDGIKKNAEAIDGISSGFQGDVVPSFNFTNAPKGIYAPLESGTYQGGIVVDLQNRPLTQLVWNGTALKKKGDVEIVVPVADQEFNPTSTNAIANKEATKLYDSLQYFITGDLSLDYAKAANGVLKIADNSSVMDANNRVLLNIDAREFTNFNGKFIRFRTPVANNVNLFCSMLGVKADGTRVVLINGMLATTAPTLANIENFNIDITEYDYISVSWNAAIAYVPELTLSGSDTTFTGFNSVFRYINSLKTATKKYKYKYVKGFRINKAIEDNMNVINLNGYSVSYLFACKEIDIIHINNITTGNVSIKFFGKDRIKIQELTFPVGSHFAVVPKFTLGAVIAYQNSAVFESIEIETDQLDDTFNLADFGVNTFNSNELNTTKITTALIFAIRAGGGSVKVPAIGRIKGRVVVPLGAADDWSTIRIYCEERPRFLFGTIGTFNKNMAFTHFYNDTVDDCLTSAGVNQFLGLSFITLYLENLTFMVPQNPECNGVNANGFNQLIAKNVSVETPVYNVELGEPTFDKSGFITPKIDNGALNRVENLNLQGFKNGLVVNEHCHGTNIIVHSCINALKFNPANHASYFDRVMLQRNQVQVKIEGSHVFKISQLNLEYVGTVPTTELNEWQRTTYELDDPNNLGIGEVTYANVKGNVGKVNTFRINGAANIIVKKTGSDARLLAPGIPD